MKTNKVLYLLLCLFLPLFSWAGDSDLWLSAPADSIYVGKKLGLRAPDYNLSESADHRISWEAELHLVYGRRDLLDISGAADWELELYFSWHGRTDIDTLRLSNTEQLGVFESMVLLPHELGECEIEIKGLSYNGSSLSDISGIGPEDIELQLRLKRKHYYYLDPTTALTVGGEHVFNSDASQGEKESYLELYWDYLPGMESAEVELVFWDAEISKAADPTDPEFFADAIRVETSAQHYRFELSYPAGEIYYRIRPIGRYIRNTGSNYSWRKEGAWSVVGQETVSPSEAFEPEENWQYSTVYAESGKQKKVITYFDESMRARQVVTYLNDDDLSLVGETDYSLEGQAVVNILPVPTQGVENNLFFKANFNQNSQGQPYNYTDYDKDTGAEPLSTNSGASYYYSSAHLGSTADGLYVPYIADAEGYPMSQLRYKRDGTGRVAEQSGVGGPYQLGTGRETRYFYGSASTTELRRLFGSNVGNATHYEKHVTVDANGQASVAYVDQAGQTVATALAGEAPTNVEELSHKESYDQRLDMMGSNVLANNQSSMTHVLLKTDMGVQTFSFDYQVDASYFELAGFQNSLCESCAYALEIEVTDPDGHYVSPSSLTGGVLHTTVIDSNYNRYQIRDTIRASDLTNCGLGNVHSHGVSFDLSLAEMGEYTVNKRLRLLSAEMPLDSLSSLFEDNNMIPTVSPAAIDSSLCNFIEELNPADTADTNPILSAQVEVCNGILSQIEDQLTTVSASAWLAADLVDFTGLANFTLADLSGNSLTIEVVNSTTINYSGNLSLESSTADVYYDFSQADNTDSLVVLLVQLLKDSLYQETILSELTSRHREYCHYESCVGLLASKRYDARMSLYKDWYAWQAGENSNATVKIHQAAAAMSEFAQNDSFLIVFPAYSSCDANYLENEMKRMLEDYYTSSVYLYPQLMVNYVDSLIDPSLSWTGPQTRSTEELRWSSFLSYYQGAKFQIEQKCSQCSYYSDSLATVTAFPPYDTAASFTEIEDSIIAAISDNCADGCSTNAAYSRWEIETELLSCGLGDLDTTGATYLAIQAILDRIALDMEANCLSSCGTGNPLGYALLEDYQSGQSPHLDSVFIRLDTALSLLGADPYPVDPDSCSIASYEDLILTAHGALYDTLRVENKLYGPGDVITIIDSLVFVPKEDTALSNFTISLSDLQDSCIASLVEDAMEEAWEAQQELIAEMITAYREQVGSCWDNPFKESFSVSYETGEYHYTLYYYDQAGSLVQTIPPASVRPLSASSFDSLGQWLGDEPEHTARGLHTKYKYNSMGQILWQDSPDGGATNFWYDDEQRLRLSQNAKQAAAVDYSYTRYDELSRVVEVGQLEDYQMPTDPSLLAADLNDLSFPAASSYTLDEWVRTSYDELATSPINQEHLRGRVSKVENQYQANYYSYDILGNVSHYYQYVKNLAKGFSLEYAYDLVSGNVREVAYQAGEADAFYHKYSYDADNRLRLAYSSEDGRLWQKEARYYYYAHGPLARVELGEELLGSDYRYSLQGWIIGVNGLVKNAVWTDPGSDGHEMGRHRWFSRDEYAYGLGYNELAYTPIGGSSLNDGAAWGNMSGDILSKDGVSGLFNGNIAYMQTALPQLGREGMGTGRYASAYKYDQLHRIVSSNTYESNGGQWSKLLSTINGSHPDYRSSYSYDANGNIWNLKRYAENQLLDALTYYYSYEPPSAPSGSLPYSSNVLGGGLRGEQLQTNRLQFVRDGVSSSQSGIDIDSQAGESGLQRDGLHQNGVIIANYEYDEIGNLVRDYSEQIEEIVWNVQGKVQEVRFEAGKAGPDALKYEYGPMGNRLAKKKMYYGVDQYGLPVYWSTGQYYVRDPQGNVLAVYDHRDRLANVVNEAGDSLYLEELHLYGSARLGILKKRATLKESQKSLEFTMIKSSAVVSSYQQLELGRRRYELSNHLGNVLATVSDKSLGQDSSQTGQADYYLAQVSSASLYYPFGWEMPGRKFVSGEEYRFGFNGQEEDPDMGVVFKYRVHDARVGRFLSVDPLAPDYPWNSCYAFAENRVVEGIDLEGLESSRTTDKQFTAPADPKLGVPAVDGITYNVPNLQVEFELKEAQRESAQKSLYNSNKAYVGPFTAEMKRRMALQREAKQQLEASQNPIILLGQFSADGFWTVYDGSMAAYNYSQGDISKGNIHLAGALVPGISAAFLKGLKGAGKMYKCKDYAASFMTKAKNGNVDFEDVAKVERIEFKSVYDYGIELDGVGPVTRNGTHELIQVTRSDGTKYIYDNIFPEGISRQEYAKKFWFMDRNKRLRHSEDALQQGNAEETLTKP
ncbi:papain fold toxin domain-containing protein [Saprospira sp. CCB-QB6]|uniref:RHS repeat-associated core domain-containing protein n=1 Tax=Saprospira sp. CCB-QB6 TaxID=3023936 RepID=UPI00234AA7BA|nr:RHS repeat-associated core domain-containing protein [Saprospira sp. CCB-QB6]WCL81166.1 papain fold toxin domain-containing protein [Saprospira sp. CCB-QB6]